MTNSEIKTILGNGKAQFTIEGVTTYGCDLNGVFGEIAKVLEVGQNGETLWEANTHTFIGMNIEKLYPTTMRVYGFDLLGNRTNSIVKYSDITILNCG